MRPATAPGSRTMNSLSSLRGRRGSQPGAVPGCAGHPDGTLRACLEITFWVAQATGLCRPATRRTEWEAHRQRIRTAFCWAQPCSFRSAGRRPERAGRPCYPFLKHAFSVAVPPPSSALAGHHQTSGANRRARGSPLRRAAPRCPVRWSPAVRTATGSCAWA